MTYCGVFVMPKHNLRERFVADSRFQPAEFDLIPQPLRLPSAAIAGEVRSSRCEVVVRGRPAATACCWHSSRQAAAHCSNCRFCSTSFSCSATSWPRIASSALFCSAASALAWAYCWASLARMRPSDWVSTAGGAAPESCARKLFGRQADFQRLAVDALQFARGVARAPPNVGRLARLAAGRLAVSPRCRPSPGGARRPTAGGPRRIAPRNRRDRPPIARKAFGFPPASWPVGAPLPRAAAAAIPRPRRHVSIPLLSPRRAGPRPLLGRLDRGQPSQSPLHFPLLLQEPLVAVGQLLDAAGQLGFSCWRSPRTARPGRARRQANSASREVKSVSC